MDEHDYNGDRVRCCKCNKLQFHDNVLKCGDGNYICGKCLDEVYDVDWEDGDNAE